MKLENIVDSQQMHSCFWVEQQAQTGMLSLHGNNCEAVAKQLSSSKTGWRHYNSELVMGIFCQAMLSGFSHTDSCTSLAGRWLALYSCSHSCSNQVGSKGKEAL